MKILTSRISEKLMDDINEIRKKEHADRAEIVRRLLNKAIKEWKLKEALKKISKGKWTIRKASRYLEMTYHEVLDKMTQNNIDSGPSISDLRENIDSI